MAAKKKPESSKWVEVPLDAPNEIWSKDIGGFALLEGRTFAVNCDFLKLALVELDASGTLKTLSVPTLHNRPMRLKYLPEWPLLAVFHDESLELLDISDPRAPTQRMLFKYAVGHERSIASIDQDLYVTHNNGVAWLNPKTLKPEHLFDVPNDAHFGSYPTALTTAGDCLFVFGRHAGLHVYRRTSTTEFTLLRSTKKGYTPTSSTTWWSPGVLVLADNEDVIAVDTSKPEKSAIQKSCKITKTEIESQLCRMSETEAFVGAASRGKSGMVAAMIDFTNPLKPVVTERELLGNPELRWDSVHAIRIGDFIVAGSVYLDRTYVYRRA